MLACAVVPAVELATGAEMTLRSGHVNEGVGLLAGVTE